MRHIGSLFLLILTAAVAAASYAAENQNLQSVLKFNTLLTRILLILLVLLASAAATNTGTWLIGKYAKRREKGEIKQITSVYKYVILIIVVFAVLALLYRIIGPAVTSIGLVAAGLTLALQRPILNLVGWFSIVTKRPYKIGDRIDIGSIGGYVHEIALMHTHLSLVENNEATGKTAYVPNEQALTQPIVNFMKGSPFIWEKIKVRVPANANVKNIEKKLMECVEAVVGEEMKAASKQWKANINPEIRTMLEYASASTQPYLEITARYLCNVKNVQAVKTDITKSILSKFRAELKG